MNNLEYNFLKQIYMAVTKPMQYFRLTKISRGRLTGFLLLFVFITGLTFFIPVTYIMAGPNSLASYLNNDLPAFRFSGGELTLDKRIEVNDGTSLHTLIDTTKERFTSDDINMQYDQECLVSKSNMIINQFGNTKEFDFTAFSYLTIDNSKLPLLIPMYYLAVFYLIVFFYLLLIAVYLLSALLYSLVGLIVSYVMNIRISYSTLYKTALYAKVTSSILLSVYFLLLVLTPINIRWLIVFGVMILIDCAYVVYGTLSHNLDETGNDIPTGAPSKDPYSNQ